MRDQLPPMHFKGKQVLEHLKEARKKGAYVASEIHGTELPGHFSAGVDSSKETAVILLFLWILLFPFNLPMLPLLGLFSLGWLIWKTGRSALLGWARLERLHRVIEEERYEIEHHRDQERQELKELYSAKGFEGKLLDDAVEVMEEDATLRKRRLLFPDSFYLPVCNSCVDELLVTRQIDDVYQGIKKFVLKGRKIVRKHIREAKDGV